MAAAIEQRQRRVPVSVARLRRAVDRALAAVGRPAGLVDVAVVDDGEIRELNARWRGIRRRTDVLAFPLEHGAETSPLVGQIIISADAALRQARRVRVPLAVELDLLATHATLHLVGWDDRDPVEADLMHRREREILGRTPAGLWRGLLNDHGRAGGSEPRASRTGHLRSKPGSRLSRK
jgi:probable rRNA maturation factor